MTTDALAADTAATSSTTPSLAQAHAAAADGAVQGPLIACTRRALLRRAGIGGAVVGSAGLLAACGGTDDAASTGSAGSAGGSSSTAAGGAGGTVAASEVPEGSAVVVDVDGEQVVLAQPTAGQYVAYSAVCTHQGGIVQADSGTQVKCPLHQSVFDAGDGGAVLEGPATQPLEALTVTADGDQLTVS